MRILMTMLAALCVLLPSKGQAQSLPREVTVNGVEFVLIPEGWFWYTVFALDISDHTDDRPRYRTVKTWLDSFYMAKYEARARDLERFMNAGAVSEKALAGRDALLDLYKEGVRPADRECTVVRRPDGSYAQAFPGRDLPATALTWTMADEFARWNGFRLPTEAEWEKAARGPDKRIWPWGDEYPDDSFALFTSGTGCHPAPVDSYPKGRSPYGLHHMAGNVAEHVSDWYSQQQDDLLRDGVRNPLPASVPGPDKPKKIAKGGRWSRDAIGLAISQRVLTHPDMVAGSHGVRFAADADTIRKHIDNGSATITKQ